MPNDDPEKELQEFLASKPQWVQTALQEGTSRLTLQEHSKCQDQHEWISELTEQYQQILCRIPHKWKQYRSRIMREYGNTFGRLLLPKAKPGRKINENAEKRIWALKAEGKTSREIKDLLQSEGENLSLAAVQSYFKSRRRKRAQ